MADQGRTSLKPERAERFSWRASGQLRLVPDESAKEAKSDAWISDKIKKLRAEGKSQEQAVAIAMSMAEEEIYQAARQEKRHGP